MSRVMREAGLSKTAAWRWQERFMAEGGDGLLRQDAVPGDAAVARGEGRRGGTPHPLPTAARNDTLDRPGHGGRGRADSLDGAENLEGARAGAASLARLKLSTDPAFAEKLHDVVGLYVDPPTHAVVLSVDERSQIQSLPRA